MFATMSSAERLASAQLAVMRRFSGKLRTITVLLMYSHKGPRNSIARGPATSCLSPSAARMN